MGISRPLIHADFKADGVDLFVHEIERDVMVNVSQDGQLVLEEALDTRLQRIEWDRKGVAAPGAVGVSNAAGEHESWRATTTICFRGSGGK